MYSECNGDIYATKLSLSLSLLSAVVHANSVVPPGTPGIYTLLPANLTKGVNLPYIAGKVMLTEMGVNRRGNCDPGEPSSCVQPPVSYNWTAKNIFNDAYVWHWDAGEKLESMAVGWTVYEWIGQMGVSKLTRVHASAGGTRRIHNHPTSEAGNGTWQIREEFAFALFKTVYFDEYSNQVANRGGRND